MRPSSQDVDSSGGNAGVLWRLLPLLLSTLALPAQNKPPDIGPGATISVDVNLVVLNATVRDRQGGFVSGLMQGDFRVFEDGRPQSIRLFKHEDIPVSVGLIVDNSSSMIPKRPDVAAATQAFVHASNPQDELFVVNFNEKASLGLPPETPFSANVGELEQALGRTPPGGKTALYDAIELGLRHLKESHRDKKVLIVFSDGGDNASRHKLSTVLEDAERSDVIIYTIGLFDEDDPDRNPGVLQKIASATGGEAFFPSSSKEAVPVCEQIAADIRHQYTIGYAPSNPKLDNTYRSIRVTAAKPHDGKLFVRTREGYIAASQK